MDKRDLKVLAHLLNVVVAGISLTTCPAGKRGTWCAVHAGFSIGIEMVDAANDAGWFA